MTKTIIPSTTLKSQYLQRNLKIGAIYKDPVNNFKYIVEERELNGLISKIAQPYFGSEEGLGLDDVPEKPKMQNPKKHNVMKAFKQKIEQLEALNKQLLDSLTVGKNSYDQIKELLGENVYYDAHEEFYLLSNGILFQLPKSKLKQDQDSMGEMGEERDAARIRMGK